MDYLSLNTLRSLKQKLLNFVQNITLSAFITIIPLESGLPRSATVSTRLTLSSHLQHQSRRWWFYWSYWCCKW